MARERDRWVIEIRNGLNKSSPPIGPFGATEADAAIRRARERYRACGLSAPKMLKRQLRPKEELDAWLTGDIARRLLDLQTGSQTS